MASLLVIVVTSMACAPAAGDAKGAASPLTAGSSSQPVAPPARWVAVTVATLWAQPGAKRPVDAAALSSPAHPARWVADMTLDQKQWLYGRLETQALYGTKVYLLGRSGEWSKVAVPSQRSPRNRWGYPGWVPSRQLTTSEPATASVTAVVRARRATVWRASGVVGQPGQRVMQVSYDTRFPVVRATPSYVEIRMLDGRQRALRRTAVALHRSGDPWSATRSQVVQEAGKMLGLEYLWAGTSGFGYDCSGFTYAVYHAIGVTLRRDAADQARHGTAVARASLAPGDLVFFQNADGRVVHVGIYYGRYAGVRSVIHSPGTGDRIRVSPLSGWPSGRYAGARRYLGS